MIRCNQNKEPIYLIDNNTSVLREPLSQNDHLSYETKNQKINISMGTENSYNWFPIFDLEREGKKINNSIDEDKSEKEYKNLYFLEHKDNPNKYPLKFISQKLLKKKRGREKLKKQEINNSDQIRDYRIHDKHTSDNILRKIQVHYISFIVSFINEILKKFNFKQRFLNLTYSFKKNINKEFINYLKTEDIGKILCNKISGKYKKDENINKNIYDEIIQKNEIIKKIFSEKYSLLFKNIYYKSNKLINLSEYGLNKNIILSEDVKMFKDLLKDIEKKNTDKEYIKNIKICATKHFFPNSLFDVK